MVKRGVGGWKIEKIIDLDAGFDAPWSPIYTFRAAARGQTWRRGQDYVKESILMPIMGPRRRCASVLLLDGVVKVVSLVSHERIQQRTLLETLRFKSEILKVLFAERGHSIPHGWCALIKAPKISSGVCIQQ